MREIMGGRHEGVTNKVCGKQRNPELSNFRERDQVVEDIVQMLWADQRLSHR